jgi:hypothetical protein
MFFLFPFKDIVKHLLYLNYHFDAKKICKYNKIVYLFTIIK